MINAIPFAVIGLSMVTQKARADQLAVSWFCVFYCAALVISYVFDQKPEYFYWSIISSPLFILAISMAKEITLSIILLSITELGLLIVDIFSVTTYNLGIDSLYALRVSPELTLIALQTSALLVNKWSSL